MNVLILPFDIASKGALTLDALNKIDGINAKGVFVNDGGNRAAKSSHAKYFAPTSLKKNPIKWGISYMTKSSHIKKMIKWADVIHWIWDSGFENSWDLKLANQLKIPGLIEWSGSDIRYPEKNYELNPFAHLLYRQDYEYKDIETQKISFKRQEKFHDFGLIPLVTPEMSLYIRPDLFPHKFITFHRLNVKEFTVSKPNNKKPLIVHAPSRRVTKGTNYIIEAIKSLEKDFEFDFKMIENTPRDQALEIVEKCDIFIDQLLIGSNGMASCEAMSMGKPVLCHIMPAVYENDLPAECPIISTNPNNIKQNIALLLYDEKLRVSIGEQGRRYAEKYLDVDKKAIELVSFYTELIKRNKK